MKKLIIIALGLIFAASAQAVTLSQPVGQSSAATSQAVTLSNEDMQDSFITGQTAQSTLNNNVILAVAGAGSTDTLSPISYRSFYCQIIGSAGIASGQVIFEGSNDNTTFNPLTVYDDALVTGVPINTAFSIAASTNRYFSGRTTYRYMRVRISTAFVSGTIQALTRLSPTDHVSRIITVSQATAANLNVTVTPAATNLPTNTVQYGGSAVVTGGVAGVGSVGGNVAPAAARTANPVPVGGADASNLTRTALYDVAGAAQEFGSGESVTIFSVGTGAAAVTDGTNGKTIFIQPKEADAYISFSAISTTPTIQVEVSYDNVLFAVIPFSRVDTTATSQQYNGVAAFTPVVASVWRGKTYGAPILRVHLTAGSASNTVGQVRVVYTPIETGAINSPFGLTATSTTESVGVANGQVFTGGVRTIALPAKGSAQATLSVDAVTGTLTYALEGSVDGGTTFNALSMQPLVGGATVTSVAAVGTAALPATGTFVADVSNLTHVRVHCTAYTSGTAYGSLKIVPVASGNGIGSSLKPTYTVSTSAVAATASTNVLVIESGAAKTVILKRVTYYPGVATAAGIATLTINRNTVAATAAGTAVSGASMQRYATDAAFTGIARVGAFTVSGVTSTASQLVLPIPTPISTASNPAAPIIYDFTSGGTMEGVKIPVGITNGVMFTHSGLAGDSGFLMICEFSEE